MSAVYNGEGALYKNVDCSSFGNFREVVSTFIRLDWQLNFDQKIITGFAEHSLKVLSDRVVEVCFDSSNLTIHGVFLNDGDASFTLAQAHPVLGTKITVEIPQSYRYAGSVFTIRFHYSTSPQASAVQWLPARATKGGKYPYVFTQCQAIHARSLLPCMDSPSVKTPYQAVVTAPKWCTVLMSALADKSTDRSFNTLHGSLQPAEDTQTVSWTQPVPVPAYLIALAGGNVVSRDISSRVRIWSEPEEIDAAHYEFGETEEFLQAAEAITGCAYQWGRYDVLCLPPSFPYGGTENPCLTFATPTLLAGDRSLANVIAHEIAHSWTGNLVTNATWDHFWLNEGWTMWLERKILARIAQDDEVSKLSAQIGYKQLLDDVKRMGSDNMYTSAVWPMNGQDPDDAYSTVPYEKGYSILAYLESLVGRDVFEKFAQVYVDRFKFATVKTGEFRDCFVEFVENLYQKGCKSGSSAATSSGASVLSDDIYDSIQQVNWVELFCSTGMPTFVLDHSNSLSTTAHNLARAWITHENTLPDLNVSKDDIQGWSSQQVQLFLEEFLNHSLPDGVHFSVDLLRKLDETYGFTSSQNAEVKFRWQMLCLRSSMEDIVPHVVHFITSQGRMKFVRPLYRALGMTKMGFQPAIDAFQQFKDAYHPIARKMLESDLSKIAAIYEEESEESGDESSED